LLTMTHPQLGGMSLWITPDQTASVQFITSLHSWWTNKEFEEHRAHLHPDESGAPTRLLRKPKTQAERSRLLVEEASSRLEGIGYGKAAKVKKKFDTLQQMANATPDQWRTIDGIGVVLSRRVVRDITGNEE
jgi:ERCC4-type nuclease